jgi:hypothetical protein
LGLKFDIAALPVHPELSAGRGTEQDVYYPKISVSGIDFGYAMWDLTAVGEEPLKARDAPAASSVQPPRNGDIAQGDCRHRVKQINTVHC